MKLNRQQRREAEAKARRTSYVVSPRHQEKQKAKNRRAAQLARKARRNG